MDRGKSGGAYSSKLQGLFGKTSSAAAALYSSGKKVVQKEVGCYKKKAMVNGEEEGGESASRTRR